MTPQELQTALLKKFEKRGLKEKHIEVFNSSVKITLGDWYMKVTFSSGYQDRNRKFGISSSYEVFSRYTSYKKISPTFFRRIAKGIDKIEYLHEKKLLKEEADRQKKKDLENALGPYKDEYGDLFVVEGLTPKLILGETKVPVDIKRDRISLMTNGYETFYLPLHLFIPMVKEMELERILGASQ